ncbi:hypothetical protein D3C76_1562940 [compost metagenome]
MAVRPSRLAPSLTVTCGKAVRIRLKKPGLSASASALSRPKSVLMPASDNMRNPRPPTWGLGSTMAATTRVTPALISASAQGGVRPWWEQGSRVT